MKSKLSTYLNTAKTHKIIITILTVIVCIIIPAIAFKRMQTTHKAPKESHDKITSEQELKNSFESHPQYYNEKQIYDKYSMVKKQINSNKLSKAEIINICNEVKIIGESINHISEPYRYAKKLYDIHSKGEDIILCKLDADLYFHTFPRIIDKLLSEPIILIPDDSSDKARGIIANEYLSFTGTTPLHELYIIYIENEEKYYVVNKEGKLCFSVFLPKTDSQYGMMGTKHSEDISKYTKILQYSVQVTQTDKSIPCVKAAELMQ